MSEKPDFIDNRDGNTMTSALRKLLGEESDQTAILEEDGTPVEEARIATAYFSPSGFSRIAPAIKNIPSIRLLLGTDPIADIDLWQKHIGETENKYITRRLRENLKKQEDSLRSERDHIPFERSATGAVRQLVDALKSGNMEVKRYEQNFLHAKAYIFTKKRDDYKTANQAVIAGSSNLTASGLSQNLELNLGSYDDLTVKKAKDWFDSLWEEANIFDLASFFEEIFEPRTPFEIFLRVLWELYGDEIEKEVVIDRGLPLTSFQKHGVIRALRLIEETGGVIVADEVGLGKTFIAGEILNVYKERRQRALLLCPAALRDTAWKQFQSDFELYLETKSFEELGRDKQLWDENRRPNANSNNLERNIEEYQLVIIDEAHNYRNPSSPNRADALRAFLYGKRKDVLMLTATPVNNSLWDLYYLTHFFLKQDSFLANKGILSIKERFEQAMRVNPNSLSPDVLYPIVDATTVKRTRRFIKKFYSSDQIKKNGQLQTIVFPEPKAISVRYEIDSLMPGLFDLIEQYFDPDEPECILFARYKSKTYLKVPDPEDDRIAHAVTGLLLSGLLKRFESSTGAFRISIKRMIDQHKDFLKAIKEGFVVSTEFLRESASTDDEDFDELLSSSDDAYDADLYEIEQLREDVEEDLEKLCKLMELLEQITPKNDPKLKSLIEQLEIIFDQAENEATSREDGINKRKVIIFSFFADTVRWVNDYLSEVSKNNTRLAPYFDRREIVVGSGENDKGNNKTQVAARFAPKTAGKPGDADLTDLLISTDVLAEGVNLQQARHIINYDMPWNPMRLIQRQGRIDRIGSEHSRVFMRTIFPVDRLDALLGLEERISRKIAMAAASVGIISPIEGINSSNREFTETKEEIQKLLDEDPSLYEQGGTKASVQSGEEYRQALRLALEKNREQIVDMPWKAGSGMCKGNEQGIFFCAKVGKRTYLRFVHADNDWNIKYLQPVVESEQQLKPFIEKELGLCLRLIECVEETELQMDEATQDAAYDLWIKAREDIYESWMYETDPVNLQPRIRPLNRKVAEFIRNNTPLDIENEKIERALDILESPWARRDEGHLRRWFEGNETLSKKSEYLIKQILNSGLEPFRSPDPLPPIKYEDIELIVWMAITAKGNGSN